MAITQCFPRQARRDIWTGVHDFVAETYKLALYTSTASLSQGTSSYTATGEVSANGSYVAGGVTVTPNVTLVSTTGVVDFDDLVLTSVTFNTTGFTIYEVSSSKIAGIYAFDSEKIVSNGTFTIQFPAPTSAAGALRARVSANP